jgi:hypothetical protein
MGLLDAMLGGMRAAFGRREETWAEAVAGMAARAGYPPTEVRDGSVKLAHPRHALLVGFPATLYVISRKGCDGPHPWWALEAVKYMQPKLAVGCHLTPISGGGQSGFHLSAQFAPAALTPALFRDVFGSMAELMDVFEDMLLAAEREFDR